MSKINQEVITFKADPELKQLLCGIENRSEFIRNAILYALDHLCPFCKGTGVLTEHRKQHWEKLRATHNLQKCGECHEVVLECREDG